MLTKTKFNFDNSYLSLPEDFFQKIKPTHFPNLEPFFFNTDLAEELELSSDAPQYIDFISKAAQDGKESFAQAYAGHQFGHFNILGDGRAIMLGEHLNSLKQRFDIQLKGSGATSFSRGGDGKATLKSMLREYLMSEAMKHLGISTSRSLAVFTTGEPVYRERVHQGACLIRIMKSHLRVGTFQYAAYLGNPALLEALTHYTIQRLFPELKEHPNPALALLESLMHQQIKLVANWMRIGFIHGVMNTDNVSISAETFDYGPCAFMNTYDPKTVFSSIDRNGRYAFGKQPNITKWNIIRFAEALIPIIDSDKDKAIEKAQSSLQKFDALWNATYYGIMLQKLGFSVRIQALYPLVDRFLDLLKAHKMDYTNSFGALSEELEENNTSFFEKEYFHVWLKNWKSELVKHTDFKQAKALMQKTNPRIIPRNHLVEEALDKAINGDTKLFKELEERLSRPYDYSISDTKYLFPPKPSFEENYQTFCGT